MAFRRPGQDRSAPRAYVRTALPRPPRLLLLTGWSRRRVTPSISRPKPRYKRHTRHRYKIYSGFVSFITESMNIFFVWPVRGGL